MTLSLADFKKLSRSYKLADRKAAAIQFLDVKTQLGERAELAYYELATYGGGANARWVVQTSAAKIFLKMQDSLSPNIAAQIFVEFAQHSNLLIRDQAQTDFQPAMAKFPEEQRNWVCEQLEKTMGFRRMVRNFRQGIYTPFAKLSRHGHELVL